MLRTHLAILGSIVAATFVILTPAKAGTTGDFSGYVLGPAGQPLLDATIRVVQLTSSYDSRYGVSPASQATAVSNSAGFFSMLALPPGTYFVQVELKGYYLYCPPRIAIDADQSDAVRLFLSDQRLLVMCGRQRIVRSQSSAAAYSFDEAGDWETP